MKRKPGWGFFGFWAVVYTAMDLVASYLMDGHFADLTNNDLIVAFDVTGAANLAYDILIARRLRNVHSVRRDAQAHSNQSLLIRAIPHFTPSFFASLLRISLWSAGQKGGI